MESTASADKLMHMSASRCSRHEQGFVMVDVLVGLSIISTALALSPSSAAVAS